MMMKATVGAWCDDDNGDDVACVAALWLRVPASPRRALAYTAVTAGDTGG